MAAIGKIMIEARPHYEKIFQAPYLKSDAPSCSSGIKVKLSSNNFSLYNDSYQKIKAITTVEKPIFSNISVDVIFFTNFISIY